jgi:hypothetical protein
MHLPLTRELRFYDPQYANESFTLQNPEIEPLQIEITLTSEQKQKIESMQYGVVVWGTVEYTTLDELHHTRFCYVLRNDFKNSASKCPSHNDAD